MDLLNELKFAGSCSEFSESQNFYYDYHICSVTGEKEKIMLNFTLKNDMTDEIIRFGICKKCNKCIYHKDYQSKDF